MSGVGTIDTRLAKPIIGECGKDCRSCPAAMLCEGFAQKANDVFGSITFGGEGGRKIGNGTGFGDFIRTSGWNKE